MPPEERRAAILDATVPLLREHGLAVSTRQIAEAAGVAEGTLFRVFRDKKSLVQAALEQALDPEPGIRRLEQIDRDQPLEKRLNEAVELLHEGIQATWRLFAAIRATETRTTPIPMSSARRNWDPMTVALAKLIEPDAHRLTVSPRKAARVLGTMLVATMHQFRVDPEQEEAFTTAEMVDILLHGVVGRQASDEPAKERTGNRQC